MPLTLLDSKDSQRSLASVHHVYIIVYLAYFITTMNEVRVELYNIRSKTDSEV